MFGPSGTVGNYLFAFRDLVQVWLKIVGRDIDRAGDVLLGILFRRVRVDEHRGAGIEILLRFG